MLKQLTIELTNACNSSCIFCPHHNSLRRVQHLDIELYRKLIRECASLGFATEDIPVGLCGIGEPMLHPKFVESLEIAKIYGVPIGVGTNGGVLKKYVDELVYYAPSQMVVSIDAVTKETHSKMRPGVDFESVVEGVTDYLSKLRNAPKQPKSLWLQILVSELNEHEVPAFLEFWMPQIVDIKGAKVFVKCLCPWPYPEANTMYPSEPPVIPDLYKGHPKIDMGQFDTPIKFKENCRLFDSFAQVLSDGSYVPCCMPTKDYWGIGNAADATLTELFNSERMEELRKMSKDDIEFCNRCV